MAKAEQAKVEKVEKTKGEKLAEKLLYKPKNIAERMKDAEMKKAFDFCEAYKVFMNLAKTEREAVDVTVDMLQERGYKKFDPTKKYVAGDKLYYNNRGKSLLFAVIGKQPLDKGVRITASHVDSPRIDLKPRPFYESDDMAFLKTHYYGGIKKYQWVAMQLALHGVICRKDGTSVAVKIGEDESDPVFVINDLLPHLAQEQIQRKLHEGIKGEELNVLIGSLPFKDDKVSEKVKLSILNIIFEKYGVTEEDFLSADLSLVPAHKARDIGFDRSMVGAYGHDDRVCAYTSVMACFDVEQPEYTWVNILADREEIGSVGNTGLDSNLLEYFIFDLAAPHGISGRTVLQNSTCLSADVNVALDPTFPETVDSRNVARLGYGVCLTKYTGSRGKSGTSEASAEFTAKMRNVFDKAGVVWQTGELGRVDLGGGGTVALYIAALGVDVIDLGVPVLSMHAPLEVVGKADVYSAYQAFAAFLAEK